MVHGVIYKTGDIGPAIAEIRRRLVRVGMLPEAADGVYDDEFDASLDAAVRAFQQSRGIDVDGIVGPTTNRLLDEARWRLGDRLLRHEPQHPMVGDDVAALQSRLQELGYDVVRIDGVFAGSTESALRAFQRDMGIIPDGRCGPDTLRTFGLLSRRVAGDGNPDWLRARERLRHAGEALSGKTIVIDPGHGGDDPGSAVGIHDEAHLVADIASRIERRLSAVGVRIVPTRGNQPVTPLDDRARAEFANTMGADLLVSLHIDYAANPAAEGVAAYYYGRDAATGSAIGGMLAGLLVREVSARTGMLNCRSHPKGWELLRHSKMPAVRIDLGYLSNDHDRSVLTAPQQRDIIADAIVVAIQRLFLPEERDPQTGLMDLRDIARA